MGEKNESMNQAVKRAERGLCGRPPSLHTSQGGLPNAGPSIALPSHKAVHCSSRGNMATKCRSKLHSPKVAGRAVGFRVSGLVLRNVPTCEIVPTQAGNLKPHFPKDHGSVCISSNGPIS